MQQEQEQSAGPGRPFTDAGTPESVWQAWRPGWAEFELTSPPPRAVVVAPHPDDEVLGVGGLLLRLHGLGTELAVVAVTDGDASHPGSPTLSPERLARRRIAEQAAALAELGLGDVPVHRAGLGDGRVAGHEDVLADLVAPLLTPACWVLTTWREDRHPDHEATGRAVALAAGRVGARMIEYPVWTWHWARPRDPRVPWSRARSVALPDSVRQAKRRAVEHYRSQIAPLSDDPADAAVLGPEILARLLRPTETLFV
ncbi:putative LmbE-like protein [Frankia canadensis]|uniref:Putative LmbE-like protein n=1 Tax=Frankia canadensis TaxID=1836972 RepID=A0A2I2KX70_9ACTN|nr:PIG-L family deacetylase [Frankia canadensis]SNQ50260.1 putative LmbE-like protein [Frankia canadensis]SOU57550.1 putative LmbE-like protein [Frankia canadensis]